MHFLDIDEHFPRGAFLHVLLQLVNLRAFASDDDPRARRADDDAQLIARPLDLNRADARGLELFFQLLFQLHVLQEQLVVIALHEPARPPRLGKAETKSVWMDFLSHNSFPLYSKGSATLRCFVPRASFARAALSAHFTRIKNSYFAAALCLPACFFLAATAFFFLAGAGATACSSPATVARASRFCAPLSASTTSRCEMRRW